MKVEEQYCDVLQNMETAIVMAYEDDSRLLDLDVLDALEALIRNYPLEERGISIRTARLSGPAQRVHDLVRRICEWRLGHLQEPPEFGRIPLDKPGAFPI